ncbi:MAG: glycosyltransferase family 4 protein [Acidobacteriota bacterium]|nr:glycosyltransferase family 4 protein [Acidobacteriota bacterium]
MRRILFVHTTSEVGGSDVSLAHIVERLDRERFQAVVALPSDGPLVARLERAGAEVAVLPHMRKLTSRKGRAGLAMFAATYPLGVASLASLVRRKRVDIVHTNTIHNLYGWAAARLTGRPHVWHVREIVWQNAVLMRLERALALSFATRVIVTSRAVGQMFERDGALPPRVVTIANGVDTTAFAPGHEDRVRRDFGIPAGAPLIGAAARLDVWKGLEDFIEAAAIVHRARPDVRFVVAGGAIEGLEDYASTLQEQSHARGLDDVLHFAGWKYGPDAMPAFYRSLDVFVLPSREPEPFGLVVLEAMASARPVIATAQGGPLEIVVDGATGLLVAPRDPAVMAQAMIALADDPARARAMGDAGRQRAAADYSIERTVARLQLLYDEVLNR